MNYSKIKNKRKSRPSSSRRTSSSGNNVRSKRKMESKLDPNLLIKSASQQTVKAFESEYTYSEMNLDSRLKENLACKGYTQPTEIQEASLEALISGKNLVGVASTGTGKTGAFLIPIIQRLLTENTSFTTMVVVPTRELAQQVENEFRSLTKGLNLYVSCFIGGTNVQQDVMKLKRKSHLIVGTPGRLMDMVGKKALKLETVSVLILDEFDRMLDMGFVNDIKKMVALMKNRKQTMLFSATIEKSQKEIIRQMVHNPVEINISTGLTANSSVEQNIIKVSEGENKFDLLMRLMDEEAYHKVIIFAETKRLVDKLSKKLSKAGVANGLIHGNKSQNYRTNAIDQFKKGKMHVLVATDVAARGIDVDNVSHVINYQLPMTMDSYVHRIGRTGRAGKTGKAYTFVG
ncbi:MAG: RNA helicase [Crocinitomicaceae bacterium]|nr:RNA helicase [Crocinitomicaceae bacterium]